MMDVRYVNLFDQRQYNLTIHLRKSSADLTSYIKSLIDDSVHD